MRGAYTRVYARAEREIKEVAARADVNGATLFPSVRPAKTVGVMDAPWEFLRLHI